MKKFIPVLFSIILGVGYISAAIETGVDFDMGGVVVEQSAKEKLVRRVAVLRLQLKKLRGVKPKSFSDKAINDGKIEGLKAEIRLLGTRIRFLKG